MEAFTIGEVSIKGERKMENNVVVRGIAFENDVTKITVSGLPNRINILSTLFSALSGEDVNVDMIIQNQYDENHVDISFTITQCLLKDTIDILKDKKEELAYEEIYYEEELAKVSIIGSGMTANRGIAATIFNVLAENDIFVKMVSTSEIKLSLIIHEDDMVLAVDMLHQAFDLTDDISLSS